MSRVSRFSCIDTSDIEECKQSGYSTPVCYMSQIGGNFATAACMAAGMAIGTCSGPIAPIIGAATIIESGHVGAIVNSKIRDVLGKIEPYEGSVVPSTPIPPYEIVYEQPPDINVTVDVSEIDAILRNALRVELDARDDTKLQDAITLYNGRLEAAGGDNNTVPFTQLIDGRVKLQESAQDHHHKTEIINSTTAALSAVAAIVEPRMAKVFNVTSSAISLVSGFHGIGAMFAIHPAGLAVMSLCTVISAASLFDDADSDGEICNAINYIMAQLQEIHRSICILREEMHNRFDHLEHPIDRMSVMMKYTLYNLKTQLDHFEHDHHRDAVMTHSALKNISRQIQILESTLGAGIQEIHWNPIYECIRSYQEQITRFGVPMREKDLLKTAVVLENAILHPPMIDWINGRRYVQHDDVDILFPPDIQTDIYHVMGFVTDRSVPNLNMVCEVLEMYLQIRTEIRARGIGYDPRKLMMAKILAYVLTHRKFTFDRDQIVQKATELIATITRIAEMTKQIAHHQVGRLQHLLVCDDELQEPFHRKPSDGIPQAMRCHPNCKGNGTAWVVTQLQTTQQNDFVFRFNTPGRKIVIRGMPGKDGFVKIANTGCYDAPLVSRNPSIFRHIDNRLTTLVEAEGKGFGTLRYYYTLDAIEPPDSTVLGYGVNGTLTRVKVGKFHVPHLKINCDFDDPEAIAVLHDGQHMHFTFRIHVVWYSNTTQQETKVATLTSRQTTSTHTVVNASPMKGFLALDDSFYQTMHPWTFFTAIDSVLLDSSAYGFVAEQTLSVVKAEVDATITHHQKETSEKIHIQTASERTRSRKLQRWLSLVTKNALFDEPVEGMVVKIPRIQSFLAECTDVTFVHPRLHELIELFENWLRIV